MRSEHDGDRLDAAIDAAARALTAGEPSAALRAGVRDCVGGIDRRWNGWWLVPAAVAVSVVVVALVGRALLGPPVSGGPDRVRPTDARPTNVRVTSDSPLTQPLFVGRTLSGPAAPGGPDKARPTGALVPIRQAAETPELPPLEAPEPTIPPIAIDPLETKLIAVDDSGVMPIEIEPLQIEPLRGD